MPEGLCNGQSALDCALQIKARIPKVPYILNRIISLQVPVTVQKNGVNMELPMDEDDLRVWKYFAGEIQPHAM